MSDNFVAAGGDVGALVNVAMAHQAPPELLGIHTNLPGTVPSDIARAMQLGDPPPAGLSADEQRAYVQLANQSAKHLAYASQMSTRPQTLYGMADSPVSLASWLLDHGDGDDQPAAAIISALHGTHAHLTRNDVLDNLTLYWLTNTGVSAARIYWGKQDPHHRRRRRLRSGRRERLPRRALPGSPQLDDEAYHNLIYFHEVSKGGHFAAWEQPGLYAAEVQAGFRPLRSS